MPAIKNVARPTITGEQCDQLPTPTCAVTPAAAADHDDDDGSDGGGDGTGLGRLTESTKKTKSSKSRAALSTASDLHRIIATWPLLPDGLRKVIVAVA